MKRILGISLFVLLAFSSCNMLGSVVNPVIGTWETSILGVTVSSVYNADKTFTDTNSLGSVGVTNTGTWTSTSSKITKTHSDDSVETLNYSFNSNKSEMTLSQSGGSSITYSRQ